MQLIEGGVGEARTLDYKLTLPGDGQGDRKEYLADVSSFANASGGHLLFGFREDAGIPQEIVGLGDANTDDAILRLENMIRDSIDPRIHGVASRSISIDGVGPVVLQFIPPSFMSPHMVSFRGSQRFYARNSNGKYQLDVHELRAAFAVTDGLSDRLRSFRADRLARILSGDVPVRLDTPPLCVLHLAPLSAFGSPSQVDLSVLSESDRDLLPLFTSRTEVFRHNLDGILSHRHSSTGMHHGYLQVFRDGTIESLDSRLVGAKAEHRIILSDAFERGLVNALRLYLDVERRIGAQPPLVLMLSLLGVGGLTMDKCWDDSEEFSMMFDRSDLLIPPELVEDAGADPSQIIRPLLDAVWNAAGRSGSPYYDSDGSWILGQSQ